MTIKYVNVRGGAGVAAANHATRPQDDLYLAVNGDWLATTEIPADQSMTGGVMDLFFNVEDQLLADFAKFRQQPATVQDSILREAVKLDQLALDFEKREADGIRPAQIRLAILDQLHHWDDVNDQLAELIKMGAPLPFDLFTEPDMKNTTRKLLTFGVPNLILPGKNYYAPENKKGQQLLATWHQMAVDVLKRFGFEETVATQLVDQAVAFDASLVPFVKGTEELADYTARYHPTDFAEFTRLIPAIDLNQAIADILQRLPVQINVTQPEYFKHLNQLLTTTPFEEFKAWLQVKLILETTAYLTEDLRQLGDRYRGVLGGRRATPSQEKQAYRMVVRYFDDVIGKYYGETYFGDQARQDVTQMTRQMIDIYRQRLERNTWLSQTTKMRAIDKLDHLVLKVGYPDEIPAVYDQIKVKTAADGGNLLNTILTIERVKREADFLAVNQPTDRSRWMMTGQTVDACYIPSFNEINLPAGILQAPFYSINQSDSENYGGIGTIIAHEISHAFDSNGAKFDAFGNLNNWWTPADFAAFEQRTQAMAAEFDGLDYAGVKLNGQQILGENIADAGGLSCALEAAKRSDQVDLVAFFNHLALIWHLKTTEAFQQFMVNIDVHAPGSLRTNIQAQNIDDFYQTFHVTEQDQMWLAPDKRVQIW